MNTHIDRDEAPHWALPDDLYSLDSVRGSYNPSHFVVRLDPALHDSLKSQPSGFCSPSATDPELFYAFSTYLHETIHWWQHIGSTTGLMLSLAYPAESHLDYNRLLDILKEVGGKKSLKTFLEINGDNLPAELRDKLSIVVNNWHDVRFNKAIILDPQHIPSIATHPYFDSVGHSLSIGLRHAIALLNSTFDPEAKFLPDIRKWESELEALREKEVPGFYWGSPINRLPIGGLHIFEGQARFCQLQYLYLATGDSWDEFERREMMGATYTEAFRWFLNWTKLDWPSTPIDPTVHLFLLVCDLAINPSDGYPFDLYHFESLLESVDPGYRFAFFSTAIADRQHLRTSVSTCTRESYVEVTTVLSRLLVCKQPVESAERIVHWANTEESLKQLLKEEETFQFGKENLPVRLYFAKHIRFAEDRVKHPEFFCWPAMHFVTNALVETDVNESLRLWNRHEPLFVADINGEVRPIVMDGRLEKDISQTFSTFYRWNMLYDIVRQWIIADGPFVFDYAWLTSKYSAAEMRQWVSLAFKEAFGASLDDFELVKKAR